MVNSATQIVAHVGHPTSIFKSSMVYNPWSVKQSYFMTSARDVSGFTVIGGNPGLALNVPVWFDVSIAATGGGTATLTDVQCLLFEL